MKRPDPNPDYGADLAKLRANRLLLRPDYDAARTVPCSSEDYL